MEQPKFKIHDRVVVNYGRPTDLYYEVTIVGIRWYSEGNDYGYAIVYDDYPQHENWVMEHYLQLVGETHLTTTQPCVE